MAKPKPDKRLILLAALAVVAGILLFNWIQNRRALAAPPRGSGTIEADEIEVGPQVAGRIATVLVSEGDRVVKGQIIAKLDDTELQAAYLQAVGLRDAARNTFENVRDGSRSEQIGAAQAQAAAAASALAGAEKNLASAQLAFAHATDVKQAVTNATAQVGALTAQLAAAKRQAEAAAAQAAGAEDTLRTARKGLNTVTDLKQARDAAQGQHDSAVASRERALTAMATVRTDYERISSLFQQGAVSRRDADNSRLALDTAKAALDTAEAQVTAAKAGLNNATRALNDRLAANQTVITATSARTASARQREAAEAQVRQVEAQLEGARNALAHARTAYRDRTATRIARDAAATSVATSRDQLEAARQNLALLQAGNRPSVIAASRAQWQAAEGAAGVARKRLNEAVVRSPGGGRVSTIVARAGETISAGLPVVKIIDVDHAYVRVYMSFTDFAKLKIGDKAWISTDAIPGRRFNGKVTEVATEAEFTPKNVETRDQRLQQVYWVKVAIENPDGILKSGMPAGAEVVKQ